MHHYLSKLASEKGGEEAGAAAVLQNKKIAQIYGYE
jgi:hypothetical protein